MVLHAACRRAARLLPSCCCSVACALQACSKLQSRSPQQPCALLSCRSNGYPWTFSKCDFDDFSGYADAADAVLQQRGIDLNKYKYK